ncbi:MAG: bla regulator protein blaR1 [Sphingomonadales bacterium]|jgi:beta-lactamase regulating signal transducer with metallopeptidase domain|nr:bla regulator protein blaR1 [Sphingomonadales bacterium]
MTSWLLHTFVAISLLILLVLALRQPVARLFGAGWAYSLWLIPALRLVLPSLPWPVQDLPLSVAVLIPATPEATAPLPALAGPGQWVPFLLATWAGGAVIFVILQWLGYRAFLRRLSGSARPARPPRYGGIATFVSRMVEGPLALGLIEPRIVLPADFSRRYSPGERRLAMEHELTHHRHRDLWWNLVAILVLALNWFNPLAWFAYRAFRADQELACDAAVSARATIEERCDYARALVKSASASGIIAACPINGAGALKRRLRMLRGHRASPARSAGGIAALTTMALIGATSATLRSAPVPMPQLLAQAAAAVPAAPAAAPVRLAASAPTPRVEPAAAIVVRAPHSALWLARALAPPSLPPLESRQLAQAELERALSVTSLRLMPRVRMASASPMHARALALALADAREIAFRTTGTGQSFVYRAADPAERARIEEAVRNAVAEAHEAHAQARIFVHLAQVANAAGAEGAWTKVKLQVVEQGDYQ